MIEEMGKNAAEFYGKDAKDVTAKGLSRQDTEQSLDQYS